MVTFHQNNFMLWFCTPYDFDKKLLYSIDRYFDLIKNPEDWLVIMDGDTAFLRSDFGEVINSYVTLYPETGLFTCYASRCHYATQVPEGVDMSRDSILYHRQVADFCSEKFKNKTIEINRRIAGHLMVIQKKTWNIIRNEVFYKAEKKFILGVDTKISWAILDFGFKILMMKELYIFHYLRLKEGFDYTNHLTP
jgi:GT2 family glycosyltransferase